MTQIAPKQFYNELLTRDFLKKLGNAEPCQNHLEIAEILFLQEPLNRQLSFRSRLTENEVFCLFLAAKGYSASKTAKLMITKLSTVNSYRKEIKRKLKCCNMTQAVYDGICFGYIPPKPAEEEHFNFRVIDEKS